MEMIKSALRFPLAVALFAALSHVAWAQDTPVYFSPHPGPAKAQLQADGFEVSNAAISLKAQTSAGQVKALQFRSLLATDKSPLSLLPFTLLLANGHILTPSSMKMAAAPRIEDLRADAKASRLSERIAGKTVITEFEDESAHLHVIWRIILRVGSNYVRQEVVLNAASSDVPVREVRLLDWYSPSAHVVGTCTDRRWRIKRSSLGWKTRSRLVL